MEYLLDTNHASPLVTLSHRYANAIFNRFMKDTPLQFVFQY